MSKACVEIDFFRMEKENISSSGSMPSSPQRAPSSSRGIQSVVSRINPQLLRTVMAARHARPSDNIAARPTSTNPSSPSRTTSPPPAPVHNHASRRSSSPVADTAPLTIFYNGSVATFDVPRDKAETIIQMADKGAARNPAERPEDSSLGTNQQGGDLPIARRKSLQRFLERRVERELLPVDAVHTLFNRRKFASALKIQD